ncbi:hypothetical protein Zmor_026197 [Zophobas morio]|uniref:Uncharacterized protein n=1 Tax=Zophobas morio TaxID=2755281 RepID=A0AA38HTN8_9CUCU|nr:hypothetical protein Zmor_026197 [Zophobas morio]
MDYMVNVLPDVAFVGAVFDVVAQRLEHSTGGGHITAVKNLKANFNVICLVHTCWHQADIMQTSPVNSKVHKNTNFCFNVPFVSKQPISKFDYEAFHPFAFLRRVLISGLRVHGMPTTLKTENYTLNPCVAVILGRMWMCLP